MAGKSRTVHLSNARVLVVEDEYYLAVELAEAIQRSGATVIGPFASAEEGVASLAADVPDRALVDINTGGGPSFALADALFERGVPFAFLTGYDADVIPSRFGEVQRIEKPADSQIVLEALSLLRSD